MTTIPLQTRAVILDAAERITQAVGYNGLSFRDVAAAVGIKSASVHYHFPTKGQLAAAVARRYTDRLVQHQTDVAAHGTDAKAALASYVAIFRGTLEQDGRMCLCGMLAAETDAVPALVRAEVCRFVELNVTWIAGVLQGTGSLALLDEGRNAVRAQAQAVFAALEGAMLVARVTGDLAVFDAIVAQLRRVGLLPH